MEIVRSGSGIGKVEGPKPNRFDRRHIVNVLQFSFYQQKGRSHQFEAVALKQIRSNDGVRNSSFIFKTQKDKSLGSARPLADNYMTRHAHPSPIADASQVDGARNSQTVELRTLQSEQMLA